MQDGARSAPNPKEPTARDASRAAQPSWKSMMRFKPQPLVLALTGLAVLSFAGCGGDDDAPATVTPPPATAESSLEGVVFDGLLANATVCVDLNENRDCDAGEPSATTSATGTYKIEKLTAAQATGFTVLAKAVAGTTTNADTPVTAAFTLAAPAGKAATISPYTTLVVSEVDGGRAPNRAQAEENILSNLVGTAGDVGGLTLYSNYASDETVGTVAKRDKMAGLGQLLTVAFAKTAATSGLTGKAGFGALGQAATGSLQQVLSQVAGKLAAADRDTLSAALQDSLVPTAAHLTDLKNAAAKTAAAPIEGAWVKTSTVGAVTTKELFLFAGDGTFVHQTLDSGVALNTADTTTTQFDNGFGYRYGRYTFAGGVLTTSLLEASEAAGPGNGMLNNVTVTGDTLTADGGVTFERVTGADPLVGGWVRPNGSNEPEFLVMFGDGTYVHSTFYYQNDPQTGTATFFETAKSAGLRKGAYARDTTNASVVNFGDTTVVFNGALAIPSAPGVAHVQPDGSLSMTGLRLVKLGTADGAKAVTGLSEATRSRLWSGRYFSRTVSIGGVNRLQYVYVRGPNDVLTFLQPTVAGGTAACETHPGGTPAPDFTSVAPGDGKLKQFVVGTGTAATAGYAQRRLNIGQPGAAVTYSPIAKPTNTTARCVWPL